MKNIRTIATKGFTVVELVIVVAVIAILASVTVVAYNGVQARAKDAQIIDASNQLKDAIEILAAEKRVLPYSGWGSPEPMPANPTSGACPKMTAIGGGWAGSGIGYQCALEDLLVAYNLIPSTFISKLPPSSLGSPKYTFMLYGCNAARSYILMWYLYAPETKDTENFKTTWKSCKQTTDDVTTTVYYTTYKMRNGIVIQL